MLKKCFSFILLSLILVGCGNKLPIESNLSEQVADFSFTTQDEEKLSNKDLEGKWWIADFIFTNCTTACLPMTSNLSILQNKMDNENFNIQLISFSVDPNYDTPDVLKAYGEEYQADFSNWSFLTGYDFKTIKKLSVKSFRAFLQEPESDSDQFTHDTRFFLVDPKGKIVKGYDGLKMDSVDEIMADLKALEKSNLIQ